MSENYSEKLLIINLANIASNYLFLSKKLGNNTVCSAVVKDNAYGLGETEISTALYKAGCRDFFVTNLSQAIYLRSLFQDITIRVFFGVKEKEEEEFFSNNLIPVLNSIQQLEIWNNYSHLKNAKLKSVINFNTGMNRWGLNLLDIKYINENNLLEGLKVDLVMSHLSCAWESKSENNFKQLNKFKEVCKFFPGVSYSFANSGGVFLGKEYHFDMARVGASLYGLCPIKTKNPLKNTITLLARILGIHEVDSNFPIGYSGTCVLPLGSVVAIIPIGYFDGYITNFSNKSHCIVKNTRVPIVGSISMDMTIIDITKLKNKNVKVGDEVELIGDRITVDELNSACPNIGYQLLTSLNLKNNRKYIGL